MPYPVVAIRGPGGGQLAPGGCLSHLELPESRLNDSNGATHGVRQPGKAVARRCRRGNSCVIVCGPIPSQERNINSTASDKTDPHVQGADAAAKQISQICVACSGSETLDERRLIRARPASISVGQGFAGGAKTAKRVSYRPTADARGRGNLGVRTTLAPEGCNELISRRPIKCVGRIETRIAFSPNLHTGRVVVARSAPCGRAATSARRVHRRPARTAYGPALPGRRLRRVGGRRAVDQRRG